MKKRIVILFVMIFLLLPGCKNPGSKGQAVEMDTDNAMTFALFSEAVKAGDDAIVLVETTNNPGFLTMAVRVEYDTNAMSLTKAENGSVFLAYNFVPSKKLQSGCRMSWFIPSVPGNVEDGELLKLHFHVFNDTKAGEYPVTVSPINDGGIVDRSKSLITIAAGSGAIKVN